MSLQYNRKNIPLAQILRRNATPQENHLWYDFLANHPLRFQRQKAIDNFIADFYCHRARLIIEIDGSQHYTPQGKHHDSLRTEVLERYDLRVLRFTNNQIDRHFKKVCNTINLVIYNTLKRENAPHALSPTRR